MKLAIAIPALNEESSIESIIEQALAAREYIRTYSPVTEVEIIVISDGSTDRTVERASNYCDRIRLIVFPQNRGYGAAIKEAWMQSDADLLGFVDADGTCDPKFFADLCAVLIGENKDVVLGCRLNKSSDMPKMRRVGNIIFAALLNMFSGSQVRDTASGMRVVRRSSLGHLFPLPDGMHFTPAMSARAIFSDAIEIGEIDMPYKERIGNSKLRLVGDGLRFLRVIIEAAFLYRPARPLIVFSIVLFTSGALLMLPPLQYYLQYRKVLEWMIYRFLVSNLFGTAGCLCFCASYLTEQISEIALSTEINKARQSFVRRFFQGPWLWVVALLLILIGGALVFGSVVQRIETGETYEHWSRYIVMTFCFSASITLVATRSIDYVLQLVRDRAHYWQDEVLARYRLQRSRSIVRERGSLNQHAVPVGVRNEEFGTRVD